MKTAEEQADKWHEMAQRNIGSVTAQLANLYERLDKAGEQHREMAEQLGAAERERDEEKRVRMLADAAIRSLDAKRAALQAELEEGKGLLAKAPVRPRNAFNTAWLESVRTYLAKKAAP